MNIKPILLPGFLKNKWNQSKTGFASLALPFFLLLIVSLWFFRYDIVKILDDWKFIPKDEVFTELYLIDYDGIDHRAPKNGNQIDFSFAISNHEGKKMSYKYEVYLETEEGKNIIDRNSISVENEETAFVEEKYIFTKDHAGGFIRIQLLDPSQSIHILLNK